MKNGRLKVSHTRTCSLFTAWGFQPLSANLLQAQLRSLPEGPGVYYFLNGNDYPVYIGKSVNIRQRVRSHFYGAASDLKEQKILGATHRITWQDTAGELSALLLESREIKRHSPLFNRRLRKQRELLTWQVLNEEPEQNNEPMVKLVRAVWPPPENTACFGLYRNKTRARKHLELLVNQQALCKKILGLESGPGACFGYQLKRCFGVCVGLESAGSFRHRLDAAIATETVRPWPFAGPVGIIETRHSDVINVVDQWYFLGTAKTIEQAHRLCGQTEQRVLLDRDSYSILVSFVLRPNSDLRIIELAP